MNGQANQSLESYLWGYPSLYYKKMMQNKHETWEWEEKSIEEKLKKLGFEKTLEEKIQEALPTLFKKLGIDVDGSGDGIILYEKGERVDEIGPYLTGKKRNGKSVFILISARCKIKKEDVNEFMKTLKKFHKIDTVYKNDEVIGIIGSEKFRKDIKEYAEKNGLYIVKLSDETVELLNKKEFKPKIWR